MTLRFVGCVSMQWCVKSHCVHVTVIMQTAESSKKYRTEKEAEAANGEKNARHKNKTFLIDQLEKQ